MATKTKHAQNVLKSDIEKLRAVLSMTAKDATGQASAVLSDSYDNIMDKSHDVQGSVAEYVGERPFKALGIAMLSGWLLGYALRKKRRYIIQR